MKTLNNAYSRVVLGVFFALLIVLGSAFPSFAQVPVDDEGKEGVITVSALRNSGTVSTPVSGAVFELHRVKGLDVFDEKDWDEIRKREKSKRLDDLDTVFVSKIGPTDKDGSSPSIKVRPGFYVVKDVKGEKSVFAPSFFTLPASGANGEWSYDLVVHPKVNADGSPTAPEHTPSPASSDVSTQAPAPDGADAKTGGVRFSPVALLVGVSLAVLGLTVAFVLRKRGVECE